MIARLSALLLPILVGCTTTMSGKEQSIPQQAEVLHSSILCGDDISTGQTVWISNQTQLEQRYAEFNAQASEPVYAPKLDFDRSGALLIAMGPQPSTGYLLSFIPDQDNAWLAGDSLVISVDWTTPAADSIQAQVITNPCLLLQLDRIPFEQVKIIDQNGEIRLKQ